MLKDYKSCSQNPTKFLLAIKICEYKAIGFENLKLFILFQAFKETIELFVFLNNSNSSPLSNGEVHFSIDYQV